VAHPIDRARLGFDRTRGGGEDRGACIRARPLVKHFVRRVIAAYNIALVHRQSSIAARSLAIA
jgi:hypothetical protein